MGINTCNKDIRDLGNIRYGDKEILQLIPGWRPYGYDLFRCVQGSICYSTGYVVFVAKRKYKTGDQFMVRSAVSRVCSHLCRKKKNKF